MKKLKVMLFSFALVAVVGGALAFKAKFDTDFCVTTESVFHTGLLCETPLAQQRIDESAPSQNKIYFTVQEPAGGCAGAECINAAKVSLTNDN